MKRFFVSIFTLLLITTALYAANTSQNKALLVSYDDIEIKTPTKGTLYVEDLYEGMEVPIGSTIITGSIGYAELELDPNGSVIKMSANTTFKINNLAGGNNKTNSFKAFTGKVRIVAATLTGDKYTLEGNSSVCGVQGTDFGMDLDEGIKKEEAFVLKGEIDFSKNDKDGKELKKIKLGKGQKANIFDDDFKPIEIPPAELIKIEDEHTFKKLKDKADKLNNKDKDKDKPTEEPSPEPTPEPSVEPTAEPTSGSTPAPTPGPSSEPTAEPTPTPKPEDPLMKWLRETLGMEIGSITIGDKTYSKAVLQPTINLGKFKTALYLPIIYEKDMFNPDNWYHPKGNDEWSFGTDQGSEILPIATDFLSDLFLKIKYIQWGDIRDDFFFKVGNVNNFTIGHGLIMNNYANDADFPAIRRIGVNLGMDFKSWGFEALVNDLTETEIFGSRLYFRPGAGPLALGVSVVADINPAGTLPTEAIAGSVVNMPTAAMVGNPMFFNLGLDLDFPLIDTNDFLSIIFFTDAASMVPYFQNTVTEGTYTNVTQGPAFDAVFNNGQVRNIGLAGGVFGNIWLLNYNLQARYFSGTFIPSFFGSNYDRISGDYAISTARYINAIRGNDAEVLAEFDALQMGIYGEAGMTIPKVLDITIGYMWPFKFETVNGETTLAPATIDELHLKAALAEGIIPGVDISGSLSYDRTNFAPMLAELLDTQNTEHQFGWIDAYTVLKGEVIYGVSPNLDVAGLLTGAVGRNSNGTINYNDDGTQVMDVTFSIETRVHF